MGSITTLYIGSVPPTVTKRDLHPYFLAYGEIKELSVDASKLCAYVTFLRRESAEACCKATYNNLTVKNTRLRVMWAKRKKGALDASSSTLPTPARTPARMP